MPDFDVSIVAFTLDPLRHADAGTECRLLALLRELRTVLPRAIIVNENIPHIHISYQLWPVVEHILQCLIKELLYDITLATTEQIV